MSASLQEKVGSAEVNFRWLWHHDKAQHKTFVQLIAETPKRSCAVRVVTIDDNANWTEINYQLNKHAYHLLQDVERMIGVEQCQIR